MAARIATLLNKVLPNPGRPDPNPGHPGSLSKTTEKARKLGSRERKISPKFFRPKFFRGRPRGMPVPKRLFFQDLEGLTEVFGRMSAGTSGRKLRSLG